MNVLVVGSGGREHALSWAIRRSPLVEKLYAAPGNGGTASVAENVPLPPEDIEGLVRFAAERRVDLTVIGPEAPLVAGAVDRFRERGLRCFGPTRAAARLEGSKVFAKEFMRRHGIPTADFAVVEDAREALRRARSMEPPVVVKADGLAAGKGVIVARTRAEAEVAIEDVMVAKRFGESGARVVLEEFLEGDEVSVHSICCGERAALLPSSQDHKRALDHDRGPNTGGMGAYAPVPFVSRELLREIDETIVRPTLRGMEAEGSPFTGVLYAGLMMTRRGPRVLEFNVRFGDPETQALVPLVRSDLAQLLHDCADGRPIERIELHEGRFAAAVVMASEGYPADYRTGAEIVGADGAEGGRRVVFHAGTARVSGKLVTSGGRVLAVTAWSDSARSAIAHAYEGVGRIRFEGAHWRKDIGRRAL